MEYDKLIINNDLEKLLNINEITDLVNYSYNNKYLIEYLLEKGIYNERMQRYVEFDSKWIKFYLKYNIIEPLLNCRLKPLLEKYDDTNMILDILLNKIDDNKKIDLYHNIVRNSYWEYHDYEEIVIKKYLEHGISLTKIFVKTGISDTNVKSTDNEIINEFLGAYKDHDSTVINIMMIEINERMKKDANRMLLDLEKLIKYKKENPLFKIRLSNTTEGEYNKEKNYLLISPFRLGVFTHEVSHLLFESMENSEYDYDKYNEIISDIKLNSINKIYEYVKEFHKKYDSMRDVFEKKYYTEINEKHGSYNNYIKLVCKNIMDSKIEMITDNERNKSIFFIDNDNITSVVSELLLIEKEEYIENKLKNHFKGELMLENLLDAILDGKLFDDLDNIKCLSGHGSLYFTCDNNLSFNECLADYDMIKNSSNSDDLIDILDSVVGSKLIDFLNDYLLKNRSGAYGH